VNELVMAVEILVVVGDAKQKQLLGGVVINNE